MLFRGKSRWVFGEIRFAFSLWKYYCTILGKWQKQLLMCSLSGEYPSEGKKNRYNFITQAILAEVEKESFLYLRLNQRNRMWF